MLRSKPNPSLHLGGVPRFAAAAVAAAIALALTAAAAPALLAQDAGTGWRVAATWRSADVALPAGTWRAATGVDVVADGRILVADAAERRVTEIAADGTARILAGGAPAGLLGTAHLAADAARDRLYVADPEAGAIAIFDLAGARLGAWPGVPGAAGIAVAPDGRVVATAGDTGEVIVFDAGGAPAASWVAAAGEGEDRVRGVHVGADGTVHVVDALSRRLRHYDLDGTPRGDLPLDIPDTIEVMDVALEEDGTGGRFWFATTLGLYAHRARGGAWDLIPRGDLSAIALHPAVGTVVAQRGSGTSSILRYPYAVTSASTTPNATWSGLVALAGTLDGPEAIAFGADGRAYVLDRARRVQRFAVDGFAIDQLVAPNLRVNPLAVTAASDGATVATDGGVLSANAVDGAPAWQVPAMPAGRDGHAVALAFDPSAPDGGAVHLLDGFGGRVYAYRMSDGARMPAAERALADAPDGSTVWADLDRDAEGTLYALDRGARAVHALPAAPDGAPARVVPLAARARRLAVAPDGAFYTLDRDGWVRRYTTDGTPDGAFDATRFDVATASTPSDLAVGPGGDVFVTDRTADVVTRFAPDPAVPAANPPDSAAQCRHFPDKTAAPAAIDLGQRVEVRLSVRGGCGGDVATDPRDILLLLDRSGSMAGDAMQVLRLAASTFIADVDLSTSRVGLISFADDATTDVGLTDDPRRLRAALAALEPMGGTAIRNALLEAELEFGRRGRPSAARVIVLFSDGFDSGQDRDETRRIATRLKRAGVEVYTVGIGASTGLMRQLASDDAHHFAAQSARFLYAIFEAIAARVTTPVLFQSITVVDELPANMQLVPSSAVPPPDEVRGQELRWTFADVPFTGLGLRFEVEPLAPGTWPTNVRASADVVDGFGVAGRLDFPVPTVLVRTPPTPGHEPPTPTATAIPSATATASMVPTEPPSPTPTATRTAAPPVPVYIPLALAEPPCRPGQRHADAVLVMDTSSSMAGAKIAASRAAARRFVDLLDLPRDRVALVVFDDAARVAAPLGSSRAALTAALDALAPRTGTRIDLGLERAIEVLRAAGDAPDRVPAIVLLTDGRQPDETRSIAVAAAARAEGIRLYAIGLGDDVDLALLLRLADDPARAFRAPQPADLERIYAQIASAVPCPVDSFWGGR